MQSGWLISSPSGVYLLFSGNNRMGLFMRQPIKLAAKLFVRFAVTLCAATAWAGPGPSAIYLPSGSSGPNYTVSWATAAAAQEYELQEKLNTSAWVTVATVDASTVSANFSGKSAGTYNYQVRSCSEFDPELGRQCSAWRTGTAFNVIAIAAPTFSVASGTYNNYFSVAVSTATSGAAIQYSFDNANWAAYSSAVLINQTTPLYARSVISGVYSATSSVSYSLVATTPSITPNGGSFIGSANFSLSSSTTGATIHYTVDGSTPTTSSSVYSGGQVSIAQSATVKAIAVKSGMSTSGVMSSSYFSIAAQGPSCSPNGGTYVGSTSLNFSGATAGSTVYYTLNGSTPTTSSTVYNGTPIALTQNATVKAIAVKPGMANSAVTTCAPFTIKVYPPVFSPNGGNFVGSATVSLSSATGAAKIYYTTDGSTPTSASALYSGTPITLTQNTTIKAIAALSIGAMADSDIATSNPFVIAAAAPSCSPNGGTFAGTTNFSFTGATTGSTVYYTLDGSTPTTSSAVYSGSPITLSQNATVKAFAVKAGMANSVVTTCAGFAIKALAPSFSPNGGSFSGSASVTMSSGTSGATIHYTTDGSTPTTSSAAYPGSAISLTQNATLKAIAIKSGMTASDVTSSSSYTIAVHAPSCSPNGSSGVGSVSLSLSSATAGSTIHYTTDGNTPTTSSAVYSGSPITLTQNATVKALAVKAGMANSAVTTCAPFTVQAYAPTFSPNGGNFTGSASVTISTSTSGATIHYTTDGSTPTTGSTAYSGSAISLTGNTTLKAIAAKSGMTVSSVSTSSPFTIAAVAPSCSPNGGTFVGSTNFSFIGATTGSTIYYTLDGSTPTTSSVVYSGSPITLTQNATVKAFAVKVGMANSAVTTCSPFTVKAYAPTFSPNGGSFTGTASVTLNSSTIGATIHYTTDGNTPTTGSTAYSGSAIGLMQNATIKAIAVKAGMTASDVAISNPYTIAALAPSCNPNGGTFIGSTSFGFNGVTAGATVHYTLDGSTPTTSSSVYNGSPITLAQNATVKAFVAKAGMANSAISTCSAFVIKTPAPTLTPAPGSYVESVQVTLQNNAAGAQLRYTLDGSEPTSASALYSTPFLLTQTTTVKVIAEKAGQDVSETQSATYTIAPSPWVNVGICDAGTGRQTQICTVAGSCTKDEYRQVACTQAVIDCNQ